MTEGHITAMTTQAAENKRAPKIAAFTSSGRILMAGAALIFMITLLVYLPATRNDFVDWDDGAYIVENRHIRPLDLQFLQWAFTSFYAANWHPVTWISHALDVALWDLDARMHHFTNISLHAINTVLVFLLGLRLIARVRARDTSDGLPSQTGTGILPAFLTALLFGLHPIHVESVAWMAERKDLLCAFFVLLSMLQYLQYTAANYKSKRSRALLLGLLFFALAAMSKPMAVTLPVILILLDIYPLKRFNLSSLTGMRPLILEKVPFFVISLISGILTIVAQHSAGATAPLIYHGMLIRFINAIRSLVFYLEKIAFPFELAPIYPFPLHFDPGSAVYVVSSLIVIGITIYCIWMWPKEKPIWLTTWSIYVISLLPVIGILQVGNQAAADRYAYLPSIAPFLLIGLGGEWIWRKKYSEKFPYLIGGLAVTCFTLIFTGLSYLTVQQIKIWTNSEVLWKYEISIFPKSAALAYNNLGFIYNGRGLVDEAIEQYEKALEINPNYALALANLGNNYRKKGYPGRAKALYEKAIKVNPKYTGAMLNLADVWMSEGLVEKAVLEYEKVLEIDPESAEGHYSLGVAYYEQGRLEKAISHYQKALDLNPEYSEAYYNLGISYEKAGMPDNAISAYEAALKIDPLNSQIHNNLGSIYGTKGMFEEASREFQKVLELGPENGIAYYNLSGIFFLQKEFALAVEYCDKALKLNYPVPEGYLKTLESYRPSPNP
ncbi:MAG: hypothetical protein COT35_08850 [Nitrospirae bacterium CG08_land_8_20_14_0_20_52_24]|nr:MAG: hypothetical protein COT35_08850 [Nitrospirae bacterium CG08_land_8_20_14_0_20_52_24]